MIHLCRFTLVVPRCTKTFVERFWWSNMKQDIAQYVAECDVCLSHQSRTSKTCWKLYNPLLFLNGNGTKLKWTSSLDFLDRRRVMMLSLSSLTGFSKVAHFLPVKETITVGQLADLLCFQNCFTPWHPIGDQLRSWQPLYLKVLGKFSTSYGNSSVL